MFGLVSELCSFTLYYGQLWHQNLESIAHAQSVAFFLAGPARLITTYHYDEEEGKQQTDHRDNEEERVKSKPQNHPNEENPDPKDFKDRITLSSAAIAGRLKYFTRNWKIMLLVLRELTIIKPYNHNLLYQGLCWQS